MSCAMHVKANVISEMHMVHKNVDCDANSTTGVVCGACTKDQTWLQQHIDSLWLEEHIMTT